MKRIVLLTGSSGRLGSAFAEKYYDDYYIIGVARNKQANFTHYFIQGDINVESEKIVEQVLNKFKRIDVLINAAAIYNLKSLQDTTEQDMKDVLQTNLITPHILTQIVLNKFWASRPERNLHFNRNIINVSSISAFNIYDNQGSYAISKAGLNTLTRFQAEEYAQHGLRVNGLLPTSFPGIISCESVADAVVAIDRCYDTGTIKVLESDSALKNWSQ